MEVSKAAWPQVRLNAASERVQTPYTGLRIQSLLLGTLRESGCLGMQPKMGGKFHLKLNMGTRPIANKYREGKMKSALKRGSKVREIVSKEASRDSSLAGAFIPRVRLAKGSVPRSLGRGQCSALLAASWCTVEGQHGFCAREKGSTGR